MKLVITAKVLLEVAPYLKFRDDVNIGIFYNKIGHEQSSKCIYQTIYHVRNCKLYFGPDDFSTKVA
jgi:putative exporter of polyketide antibiotics